MNQRLSGIVSSDQQGDEPLVSRVNSRHSSPHLPVLEKPTSAIIITAVQAIRDLYGKDLEVEDCELSTLAGVEGLARIMLENNSEKKVYGPSVLYKKSVPNDLIAKFDKKVIQQSFEIGERACAKLGKKFGVSVNLSQALLESDEFEDVLIALSRLNPLVEVTFEVLESIRELDRNSIGRLRKLQDLGSKIAIDDFGRGNSVQLAARISVSDVRISEIKIDGIDVINKDPSRIARIVRRGLSFATEDARIVFEGVDGGVSESRITQLREMCAEQFTKLPGNRFFFEGVMNKSS